LKDESHGWVDKKKAENLGEPLKSLYR